MSDWTYDVTMTVAGDAEVKELKSTPLVGEAVKMFNREVTWLQGHDWTRLDGTRVTGVHLGRWTEVRAQVIASCQPGKFRLAPQYFIEVTN